VRPEEKKRGLRWVVEVETSHGRIELRYVKNKMERSEKVTRDKRNFRRKEGNIK